MSWLRDSAATCQIRLAPANLISGARDADRLTVPVAAAERRASLNESEWRKAVDDLVAGRGQLAARFEPIVDLHRGTIAGYESIAQFPGPPDAPAERWLREASHIGAGVALEIEVLRLALERLGSLPDQTFLSVNVSPGFLASPVWQRLLSGYARLDRLVIELTEHSAIEHFRMAHGAIKAARQRGAMLAVDDTGSGYANLQYLMRLRPDFLKLDRAVTAKCDRHPARAAMIEAAALLASRIDAWVVAEGVETEAELRCLIRLGVPLAQGAFLGAAGPTLGSLSDRATQAIASRRKRASDQTLASAVLETWPSLAEKGGPVALPLKLTLVLDAEQRPVSWIGPGVSRGSRPLMVKPHTALRALARRAMARSEGTRFLPIICVDSDGRYLGVVRVEQIVNWLASR
jgi:EAL domain-containing protein (putative c-di-GMP-specific phosphodiesterase class I)